MNAAELGIENTMQVLAQRNRIFPSGSLFGALPMVKGFSCISWNDEIKRKMINTKTY